MDDSVYEQYADSMDEGLFDLSTAEERRAKTLHEEAIVIDGCVPTTAYLDDPTYRDHLQRGGVTAAAITAASRVAYPEATRKVERIRGLVAEHDDAFTMAESAADIRAAKRADKTAILLALQDTMPIIPMDRMILEGGLEFLQAFDRLGVRVIQLTYNSLNYVGAGCCERVDPGLSNFGQNLVEELNRLGIVIDLSHCGDRTTMEAIEHSAEPVVCTHAGARALSNLERNKTDEQIEAIGAGGGVVGVSVFPPTVKSHPDTHEVQESTIHDVLDHVDHVVDVAGVDHVAFGSDMSDQSLDRGTTPPYAAYRNFRPDFPAVYGRGPIDHYEPFPRGLHRHTKLPNLTRGLVTRGYSDDEIRKILGGNLLRVFETVR
ncbi:dipeptidase [Natronosalvus amylolyticus]|uniref:dipeptidase n=1 Tax=Natronosalvus amylolyticus TaxID=2961994 RepID=UPI0020C9DC79|nr:membrane dipeptidase [Natronosalvus amylolyticus]